MKKSLKKPVLLFALVVSMAAFAEDSEESFTVPYGDDPDISSVEDFGVMGNESDEQMDYGSEMNSYPTDNSEQITDDSYSSDLDSDNSGMPTDDSDMNDDLGMNYGQTVDSENNNALYGQDGDVQMGDGIELATGENTSPVSYQGAGYHSDETEDDLSGMDEEFEPEE